MQIGITTQTLRPDFDNDDVVHYTANLAVTGQETDKDKMLLDVIKAALDAWEDIANQ